jgi:hypothetical protein
MSGDPFGPGFNYLQGKSRNVRLDRVSRDLPPRNGADDGVLSH